MKTVRTIAIGAGAAMALAAQAGSALEEITVAYFLEWPMPFQHAKVEGAYDAALGVKVNWVSFESGTAMSAAMASGDVHMAVSQGATPVVVATSAGQDLQILDVAISYADNDNCVVAERHEIDQASARELEGKKVGLPQGTTAHFGFLRQMEHFGVDLSTMQIVDMAPADGAAAFAQGELDMVCGWGGALGRMKEHGNVLLTGAEKEALGILVFDVTSAPAGFIAENPDLVAKFLKVTADANAAWNGGDDATMLPVIARDAGMDEDATASFLDTVRFPGVEEQLSDKWLGGTVQAYLKGVADVFVEAGGIDAALPTYDNAVNASPLTAVASM